MLERFGQRPVHLFVFTRQHRVWRYCGADRDIVIGGDLYTAAQIERSEIKQSIEPAKDKLTLKMPYRLDPTAADKPTTQALGDNWRPDIPTDPIAVVCLAWQYGSPDAPRVEWMGEVIQPKFTDVELTLTCAPGNGLERARRQGPKWQIACWKTVYSTGLRGCNLDPAPIPVAGLVTAVAGKAITAPAFVPQVRPFLGGTAAWVAEVPVERSATVVDRNDLDVELSDITDIVVGTALTWPGGGGTVTALTGHGVRLDAVAGLAVDAEVTWMGSEAKDFTAAIVDHSATTLTLSAVTGLAVGSAITAYTRPLWVAATVTAASGLTLTAPELALALFDLGGGFVTWTSDAGMLERRSITGHSGASLTLLHAPSGARAGTEIRAWPGCPRTWAACVARANSDHYGGSLFKPVNNPASGGVSMSWG